MKKQLKTCRICNNFTKSEKDQNGRYPQYKVEISREDNIGERKVQAFYICYKCYKKLRKECMLH